MTHFTLAATAVALAIGLQPALAQTLPSVDKTAQAQPPGMDPANVERQFAKMQEHMAQMKARREAFASTQDPKERDRLLQEHWAAMQEAMSVMHGITGDAGKGMMGPGMMGGSMMGPGHMRGNSSALTQDEQQQRQSMMARCMPMQQAMMDHMAWHQRSMRQQPPSVTK